MYCEKKYGFYGLLWKCYYDLGLCLGYRWMLYGLLMDYNYGYDYVDIFRGKVKLYWRRYVYYFVLKYVFLLLYYVRCYVRYGYRRFVVGRVGGWLIVVFIYFLFKVYNMRFVFVLGYGLDFLLYDVVFVFKLKFGK